jgi:hypothetical protein
MLRNKKKCKNDIKLRNDLTKIQRDYLTKILNELNDRKSIGEVNLSLKYDRGIPSIVSFNDKSDKKTKQFKVRPYLFLLSKRRWYKN